MRRAKEMVHTGQNFSWRRYQGCRDLPEKGKSIVEEREAGSGRVSAPSLVSAGAGLHLFKPKSTSSCMSFFFFLSQREIDCPLVITVLLNDSHVVPALKDA